MSACTNPKPGDHVKSTVGVHVWHRVCTRRDGYDVFYRRYKDGAEDTDAAQREHTCWISAWSSWCQSAQAEIVEDTPST